MEAVRLNQGTRLGPYEVVALLGAGGMGEVYRARDTRLERDVAIKVLPESTAQNPRALAHFERETKAVAALSHPNILSIHDVGMESGISFAVMELLEGENVATRLSSGPLPWKESVRIGAAIADGLAAAHSKGIVHRDLKPANVFLTSDGRVKILDFGLARTVRDETGSGDTKVPTISVTEAGTVLGTIGYMSPEQVRGEPAGPASDVFSLGCMLYEMVAGARPFTGGTAAEVMAAVLRDDPPPPRSAGRAMPPELDLVIARCLGKTPADRFQSARDLAFALRSLVSEPHDSTTVSLPAAARSRRSLAVGGALAAAAALSVGLWALSGGRVRPVRIASLAVLPLANLSGDPDQEYFADGMTDELITHLSKIHELRVISRTSVMRFKGSKESLPAIAKALSVDAVVEGSVRRVGAQIRVSAKLVRAATEQGLWTESYERDVKDVFALQSDVARAIAREVGSKLSPQEEARLAPGKPVDSEAYAAYLKAHFYRLKNTADGLEKAHEYADRAIQIAPAFAPGYSELAFYHLAQAVGLAVSPGVAIPKAEAAVRRALELDPNLPDAHFVLGNIYLYFHRDFEAAERESRRSAELRGGPDLLATLIDRYRGNFDRAIEKSRRLLERDPLALNSYLKLGTDLAWDRRYDQAIEVYKKGLEIHADSSEAHELLADAYALGKRYREAVDEQSKALVLAGFDDWADELGRDFASSGWEKAQKNLARKRIGEKQALAREGQYVSPFEFASLNAILAEKDEAFRWLEKALEERSPGLVALKTDPQWDSIRSDPRFAGLVRRIQPRG